MQTARIIEKLILGTVQLGIPYGINNTIGQPNRVEAISILNAAYEQGIRLIDTAQGYGVAESVIGQYHAMYPQQVFSVITKFHVQQHDTPTSILEQSSKSLDTLRIDSFECYQFHRAEDALVDSSIRDTIFQLRQQRVTKKIGVSIYTNEEFEAVLDIPEVDVIQIPFNVLDNNARKGHLIQKAKQRSKQVHARSIYLQGVLFMLPELLPVHLKSLASVLRELQGIADIVNISVAELSMRYAFHQPDIEGVLFGAESMMQVAENCSIAKTLPLPLHICESVENMKVSDIRVLNPSLWSLLAHEQMASQQ